MGLPFDLDAGGRGPQGEYSTGQGGRVWGAGCRDVGRDREERVGLWEDSGQRLADGLDNRSGGRPHDRPKLAPIDRPPNLVAGHY
jgi:hypothetical protein